MDPKKTAKFDLPDREGEGSAPRPFLTVYEGPDLGREFPLLVGETVLGRSRAADITLADDAVSRRHVLLRVGEDGACTLEDLESTNGTRVNGEPVDRRDLQDGDQIRVGGCLLKYEFKSTGSRRYTRRLYELATRDALTGLLNRKAFDDRLVQLWDMASRAGTALAVVIIDIDNFKQINDEWGHLTTGDVVLRRVAGTLQETVRKPDLVARWGGDEFVVLLPGSGPEQALATAERIGKAIRKLAPPSPGPERITASIGCAARGGNTAGPDDLMRVADEALYRAKEAGRDCCRLA